MSSKICLILRSICDSLYINRYSMTIEKVAVPKFGKDVLWAIITSCCNQNYISSIKDAFNVWRGSGHTNINKLQSCTSEILFWKQEYC